MVTMDDEFTIGLPDTTKEAAWAICAKGASGPELWFFEAHLTYDDLPDSPTGEGFYFASWKKGEGGRWGEHDGGLYRGYSTADELAEVIGETVPFSDFTATPIPYLDFDSVCFNDDRAAERRIAAKLGIPAPEHGRKPSTYNVTICETLKRTVRVSAKSADEAHERVEHEWREGRHVLGAEDFTEVHFRAFERRPDREQAR
jgi:hypothetical protein